MKKMLSLLAVFPSLVYAETLVSKQAALTPPEGFELVIKAEGDLNGDKRSDLAVVLQKPVKKTPLEEERGQEVPPEHRHLIVYFNEGEGYKKVLQTREGVIPVSQGGCHLDPMDTMEVALKDSVKIEKGYLWLSFGDFFDCGSWQMGKRTYQVRYKNDLFSIIGEEEYNRHRGSGVETFTSRNYLTGKAQEQVNTPVSEDGEKYTSKTSWHKLSKARIEEMKDLSKIKNEL